MAQSIRSNALLSAVLAGLPVLAVLGLSSSARGQYQLNTSGHLLDANNRVGSGGYNGAGTPHDNYNVNNNVVTGNVSGLNYFHDNRTAEFDPNTFQGNTGSSSFESFNAAAAPVDYSKRGNGTPNYVPYYNNGNTVGQLPNSYVTAPGGTGFIPAPVVSPLTPTAFDSRLDQTNIDPTRGNLLPPDELNVGGPIDPSSGAQSMYSMSPLYGVRQADGSANGSSGSVDTFFNGRYTNVRTNDPAARSRLTPAAIQQMRDELNKTASPADQSGQAQINTPQTNGTANGSTEINQTQQLNTTATGSTDQLANQALTSSVTDPTLNSGLDSGQGIQNQLLIPAAKQSRQLQEMEKRYAKTTKLSDMDATKRFNDENRILKTAGDKPGSDVKSDKPGYIGSDNATGSSVGTKTGTGVTPAAKPILTKRESAEDNQPYIITSLATGIQARGLANLMKTAEDQMRQGKFTEAVDTYQTAEQVAPNNPLVALGRGFAELGSSYYGKADQDLAHAITTEPAVLVGRYDLKGFLGEDRVNFVQKDLLDIADHEKGARPLVLLAYIAHNTGDDATTAKDLDAATQRGGYNDLIKLMKQAWSIK